MTDKTLTNKTLGIAFAALSLIALFCFGGPMLLSADYDVVYRDYIRLAPSLQRHPSESEARTALDDVAGRLHAHVAQASIVKGVAHVTLSADRPIAPHGLIYFERSRVFGPARVIETSEDGRTLVAVAPIRHVWLPFGTDSNGRDLLARTMVAGRVSLLVGALGCAVALGIGVAYGAVAGYAGGRIDLLMMRFVDALYALPFIFFVILLMAFFGRRFALIFVAIGAVEWLDMARVVRGQTLSLRGQEFVLAARALGLRAGAILVRHIAPNLSGVVGAYLALMVPRVILLESFLSFLGLGVQEPLTSLGVLVADGARHIQDAPWLLIFPAALLIAMLNALALIGDGLRAALDPRGR